MNKKKLLLIVVIGVMLLFLSFFSINKMFFNDNKKQEVIENEEIKKNEGNNEYNGEKVEDIDIEETNKLLEEQGIEIVTKENAKLGVENNENKVNEEQNVEIKNNNKLEVVNEVTTSKPNNKKEAENMEKVVVKTKDENVVVNNDKNKTVMKNDEIKITIPKTTKPTETSKTEKQDKPNDSKVILPEPQEVDEKKVTQPTENTQKIEEYLKENGYTTVSSKEGNAFIVKNGNKIEYLYSASTTSKEKFFAIKDFNNEMSKKVGAKMLVSLGVKMSESEILNSINKVFANGEDYTVNDVTFYFTGTEIGVDFK